MDKSGSMGIIADDARESFNAFIDEQKKVEGEAKVTLTLFDTTNKVVNNGVDIKDIEPLTATTYRPSGWTALLDAIGTTLTTVGVRLADTPENDRPEKVMVVINTDGAENSSKEYTRSVITEMIKTQRETYSWEFIFLGADIDAEREAVNLGMLKEQAFNYKHTGDGIRKALASASGMTASYRNSN